MPTRDQKFAAAIFRQAQDAATKWPIDEKTEPNKEKRQANQTKRNQYGSMAHKLPVLIRTAGLAQALAFVEARHKADSPQHLLLAHLEQVVAVQKLAQTSRDTESLGNYMYLTHQCLAALLWYKRFAQSVLDVDASDAGNADAEPAPEGGQPNAK